MYNALKKFMADFGLSEARAVALSYVVSAAAIIILCVLARLLVRLILVKIAGSVSKRTKYKWDNILVSSRFYQRLSHLVVPIILSGFAGTFPAYNAVISGFSSIYTLIVVVFVLDSLINAADEIYRGYEVSKVRPIRGLLQVVKVIVFIVSAIIGIAILIGENPLVLIGGIGALTAIITLVFKDAILGFVAGIQLTSNDMIRIGDWIEMEKYSADGTVTDLSLTTVKVENFDKTITSIPAYALISDSFINWRGMESSGGRRIKRSIFIDAACVRLCTDEMLERFGRMELLKDYIGAKLSEIGAYNAEHDLAEPINGRRLTNLGTFRAYITEYLKKNPNIREDMVLMVRQLPATPQGIPLEIYCFANTTKWTQYENIQSDIFDHLYSAVSRFGLEVYQQPSGNDIRTALGAQRKNADI